MRYLVLSDIHANDVALEAVLAHAHDKSWQRVVFLGDAVGYYPDPEPVVQRLRGLEPEVAIVGNHDAMLLELNGVAQDDETRRMAHADTIVSTVVRDHLERLSPASLDFLAALKKHVVCDGWEATHGALHDTWAYLSTLPKARQSAPLLETSVCFVGHTHVPAIYASVDTPNGEIWRTVAFRGEQGSYRIPPRARVFVNPGSVGQPRDGVPLASYALFDAETRTVEVFRVAFDIAEVQRRVRAAGYKEALAARLDVGR